MRIGGGLLALALLAAGAAAAARETASVARLRGTTLHAWAAPEARQGAVGDETHVYAIDNTAIARYRQQDGARVAKWEDASGTLHHLNSCHLDQGRLWCAHSNYPQTPMASSVEVFDALTLEPVASHSLGIRDEGSLTWLQPVRDGFIAGFAHYDGRGGSGFKSSLYAGIVAFDAHWRRTGGWMLPADVTEAMAPYAASGGVLGPDGLLYVLGHDRPELYVLAQPLMGPTLVHVATIDIEAHGQAFGWASAGGRVIHAINRKPGEILAIRLPPVSLPEGARRLEPMAP